MIIKLPLMLHNIVSKQFKISHVPCDVIAFAKEEIPENIIRLIHDQYDEKFLDDCDTVLFVKGPIDKDMRKKIFKAADKALGEGANMMNETDFRLLKLHDDDTADFGQDEIENTASDDAEEQTIDDQVNDIVNEPDSADDLGSDDADDNADAVDKTLAAESLEDNSVSSAMHQGKSMKQWADEFKGEFTVNQLWAMARSGQDLQRLLLTMNGVSSLDDSELNEAKEEKEENKEDEEENAEDSKEEEEEEDKEKDKDSEAPGKTEENAEDSGSEDDSSDSEEDEEVVPTRFVFLKISMKN